MIKNILLSFLFIMLLTSCGSSKKTSSSPTTQQKLEKQYHIYKGTKYKYGGTDKRGFDCSGFTLTVYQNAFNVTLPRTTSAMSKVGTKVAKNKLQPGDLVFFKPSNKYNHVGIYIGDNTFIHSSTSKGVIKSQMDNVYWVKKYKFAKRVLN